jgi:hypothetical protein
MLSFSHIKTNHEKIDPKNTAIKLCGNNIKEPPKSGQNQTNSLFFKN